MTDPFHQGIDVQTLYQDTRRWLDRLKAAGQGELSVEAAQLPKIRWVARDGLPHGVRGRIPTSST